MSMLSRSSLPQFGVWEWYVVSTASSVSASINCYKSAP